MPFIYLERDVTPRNWFGFFGCEYDLYIAPITQRKVDLINAGQRAERCDILRDFFLQICGRDDEITEDKLTEFYSSEFFAQMLAYEASEYDTLSKLLRHNDALNSDESQWAAARDVFQRANGNRVNVLDHGAGDLHYAITLASVYQTAYVDAYDVPNRFRTFILAMLRKYAPELSSRVFRVYPSSTALLPYEKYNLINSCEVMEHLLDPLKELDFLTRVAANNCIMHMSTFFNSCDGQDPQHLERHNKYQDSELWFDELRKRGWIDYATDPRGCLKVFQYQP